jgi:hypothetical protein
MAIESLGCRAGRLLKASGQAATITTGKTLRANSETMILHLPAGRRRLAQ